MNFESAVARELPPKPTRSESSRTDQRNEFGVSVILSCCVLCPVVLWPVVLWPTSRPAWLTIVTDATWPMAPDGKRLTRRKLCSNNTVEEIASIQTLNSIVSDRGAGHWPPVVGRCTLPSKNSENYSMPAAVA